MIYESRKSNASESADKFNSRSVMNVTVTDCELFRLALTIINCQHPHTIIITSGKGGGINVFARVCLSVCLSVC